jgi:hypothetical protein
VKGCLQGHAQGPAKLCVSIGKNMLMTKTSQAAQARPCPSFMLVFIIAQL